MKQSVAWRFQPNGKARSPQTNQSPSFLLTPESRHGHDKRTASSNQAINRDRYTQRRNGQLKSNKIWGDETRHAIKDVMRDTVWYCCFLFTLISLLALKLRQMTSLPFGCIGRNASSSLDSRGNFAQYNLRLDEVYTYTSSRRKRSDSAYFRTEHLGSSFYLNTETQVGKLGVLQPNLQQVVR